MSGNETTQTTSDDLTVGINAVTILRCDENHQRLLETVMREDYEYLVKNPAFLEGRVVSARGAPGTYFHITHWASLEKIQEAGQDPEIKRIFGQLQLSEPLESHLCDAVVFARGGRVYVGASLKDGR
jgi:hypothetical protein